MMTAESILLERPVSKFTVTFIFLVCLDLFYELCDSELTHSAMLNVNVLSLY